jgi:hypothetical protein
MLIIALIDGFPFRRSLGKSGMDRYAIRSSLAHRGTMLDKLKKPGDR